MKLTKVSIFTIVFAVSFLLAARVDAETAAADAPQESVEVSAQPAPAPKPDVVILSDFEGDSGLNNLGCATGSWNLDETDINNSYTDEWIRDLAGIDGNVSKVLELKYSVESEKPSQNGYWMKLENFDAREYDEIQFDVKGDATSGFTEKFKVELKKCKKSPCVDKKTDEVIKGSYIIPVTSEWQTLRIPLNKMTGIIDFADPKAWENPAWARQNLDEFVVVFQDRHVTAKQGKIFLDNIKFVKTGKPGPTAVDFPPRKIEKTPTRLEGMEFQKFLLTRLKGFPAAKVVKKSFPEDSQEFIREIAKDTWRFFDEIVDKDHGLPLDTIQMGNTEVVSDGMWVGDYTNVTNIGVYLMCLVSAYDLGFITREDAVARIRLTMDTLEKIEYHKSGFPYNYYDTTTIERTSYFVSLVDSGWLIAGLYVVKNAFPEELAEQAERILSKHSFKF